MLTYSQISRKYAWGSDEWVHDSQLIIKKCHDLGLSVSLTSGTHWSTANLTTINPDMEEASQELGYRIVELKASSDAKASFNGELPKCELPGESTKQTLVKVLAAKVTEWGTEGSATKIDRNSIIDLTDTVEKDADSWTVNYEAEDQDDYILFAFYQYGTSEDYKPSISKSYTINYFSKLGANALINYWNENVLTDELQSVIDDIDECDMFMDSLEIKTQGPNTTAQLWCADMLDEFKARRNYDISKDLPFLVISNLSEGYGPAGDRFGRKAEYTFAPADENDEDYLARMRNDFYQTTTDLYMDNCLAVLHDWLETKNIKLRAQNSYGQSFELSQPVKYLDYVETESLNLGNEIDLYRTQAGAAHLYNKRYSSETGAQIFKNYVYNTNYYMQIAYMQYASGIQKTITHGYSSNYGPEEKVLWPGYEGMSEIFGERFSERQPSFSDYPTLNEHLGRIQSVLESGSPQMDIGILRNDYNFYSNMSQMNDYATNNVHNHQAYFWRDMTLQDMGYTYDYFSPYLLTDDTITSANGMVDPDGVAYKALIVMQDEMPYAASERLLEWAENGLPIVFVNNVVEDIGDNVAGERVYKNNTIAASTTGSNDNQDDKLAEVVAKIKELPNVLTVDSPDQADEALATLGVLPRAQYGSENQHFLSTLRKTDDESYLYVYNYMYEETAPTTDTISVEGTYKPYLLNTWSGEVEEVPQFEHKDGRTILTTTLDAGDVCVYILKADDTERSVIETENVYKVIQDGDKLYACVSTAEDASLTFSDGTVQTVTADVPDDIKLTGWHLVVDSYTPGEKITRTETTEETGVTSTEVMYDTVHNMIDAGILEENLAWKDIEVLGDTVSGVGIYTNTFTLPDEWNANSYGLTFSAEDIHKGTISILVNNEKVPVNMNTASADLTPFVKAGENTIEVRVTSSYRNIMLTQDYSAGWMVMMPEVDSYGMTGKTILTTYAKVPV